MHVKTNSRHTYIDHFVHHGTCLHSYASSRVGCLLYMKHPIAMQQRHDCAHGRDCEEKKAK